MGSLVKGLWFTFAGTEVGGGASFALLNNRIKIWCASTSSTGTGFFERRCHSPEGFIEVMRRGPYDCEARFLQFTLRPSDLIFIRNPSSRRVSFGYWFTSNFIRMGATSTSN